jgi:hypothetical protein
MNVSTSPRVLKSAKFARFLLINTLTLLFLAVSASAADRFWVGNGGSWSNVSHWAATSGGAGGAPVPTSANDVYFDANSFSAPGQTVTMPTDYIWKYCKNMNWTGSLYNPTFAGTFSYFLLYGDLTFIPEMTITIGDAVHVSTGYTCNLRTNGQRLSFSIDLMQSASLILQDDLTGVALTGGYASGFTTNNHAVNLSGAISFTNTDYGGGMTINLGSSNITAASWSVPYGILNAGTSSLRINGSFDVGQDYNWWYHPTPSTRTYYEVQLNGTTYSITNSAIFTSLILNSNAAQTITFTAGTTQNITSSINLNGSAGKMHTLKSSAASAWTIAKGFSANVETDYINLSYSTAVPAGQWYAMSNFIDSGNNVGWITPIFLNDYNSDVNNSINNKNWLLINWTVTAGINVISANLTFNGTAYPCTGVPSILVVCSMNFTGLADGTYQYMVNGSTGSGFATTGTINLTVDTTIPAVSITAPQDNNSIIRVNTYNFNVSCWDNNLYSCGFRIFYKNNGTQAYSNLSDEIIGNVSKNVTVTLPSGNYTIVANATDDLTKSPEISSLQLSESKNAQTFTDAKKGVSWSVTAGTQSGEDALSAESLNLKAESAFDGKHYKTNFKYDLSRIDSKTAVKFSSEYGFYFLISSSSRIVDRSKASGQAGHLVIGNAYYWTAQDLADAGLKVTTERIDDYSVRVVVKSGKSNLLLMTELDPRTGGLHLMEVTKDFLLDGTAPVWSGNSTNDTLGMRKTIGFRINCTDDLGLINITFEDNFRAGNAWANTTFAVSGLSHNLTVNKTIPDGMGNVAQWKWHCTDALSNTNTTTQSYEYCVETWRCYIAYNSTDDVTYYDCQDTHACGTTFLKPDFADEAVKEENSFGVLFLIQFGILITVFVIKLLNVFNLGRLMSISKSLLVSGVAVVTFGVGIVVALIEVDSQLMTLLLRVETFLFVISAFFLIIEVLFALWGLSKMQKEEQIRTSYLYK